jgi:hypothetical protein
MLKPLFTASAVLAAGIFLYSAPAQAHSKALCKFDAFDTCLAAHFPHGWCVAVAEQQCANHSHGGGSGVLPGSSDYTSSSDPGIILNKGRKRLRVKR